LLGIAKSANKPAASRVPATSYHIYYSGFDDNGYAWASRVISVFFLLLQILVQFTTHHAPRTTHQPDQSELLWHDTMI
jgi:hypothetical protein